MWSQSEIDAISSALVHLLADQARHRFRELDEVFTVAYGPPRALSGGCAVSGIKKHEIDVRRIVEFVRAQLAERHDAKLGPGDPPLFVAVLRGSVFVLQILPGETERVVEDRIRQIR